MHNTHSRLTCVHRTLHPLACPTGRPLELTALEKAEYGAFQVIANGGRVLTEVREEDQTLELGIARGGVRLSEQGQAKFAGRSRL